MLSFLWHFETCNSCTLKHAWFCLIGKYTQWNLYEGIYIRNWITKFNVKERSITNESCHCVCGDMNINLQIFLFSKVNKNKGILSYYQYLQNNLQFTIYAL